MPVIEININICTAFGLQQRGILINRSDNKDVKSLLNHVPDDIHPEIIHRPGTIRNKSNDSFILYSVCFIILFDRLTVRSKIRLSRKEIAFAFSFKVLLGILYGWVFQQFYKGDDTWMYFYDSLNEYNKLLFQTGTFFKEYLALD